MTGRAPAVVENLKIERDGGRWWIADDRLCQRWHQWLDAKQYCFKLQRAGAIVHWLRDDGLSGTAIFREPVMRLRLHWRSRRLQDPWCYFGDPSHRAPVVRDVVAAGLQVRERNLHVSSEGSKINRRHWDCSHETPAAFRRATQSRQVSTIFVERKSFEVSAAASEQVDDRSQRFHSLKLSHWFSLKRSEGPCARCATPPKLAEKSDQPRRNARRSWRRSYSRCSDQLIGSSIYGVEVPWQQSPCKCTALALRSRAGIGESETSTQPRVLSPHKTHKSPTNARAAKITIAKSSARYIKHTRYRGYERTRHQTEGGLMPLSWVGRRDGGRLAPPQGPTRSESKGRSYTSAYVGCRPDSEVLRC